MRRAWKTTLGGVTSIVAANSRGGAIAATLKSAREAGYPAQWVQVRAARAPEYDGWAEVDATGVPWDPAYLPAPLALPAKPAPERTAP